MPFEPPDPGDQSSLQTIQARLVGASRNSDGSMLLADNSSVWMMLETTGSPQTCKWVLGFASTNPNAVQYPLPGPTTFAILQSGTVGSTGTISYGGVNYRLKPWRANSTTPVECHAQVV